MHLLQPSSNLQLSRKTPDAVLKHALRVVRKGYGFPSLFNADAVVEEQLRQGKTLEDARAGGCSGCVEVGAFGKEAYVLTGYFNLPKVLELALHDGVDPRTRRAARARPRARRSRSRRFDAVFAAFEAQMRHVLDVKIAGNELIGQMYARLMPAPFLSVLTDDCIRNGRDYNAGGARYNNTYIQGVGIGSLTDALAAIRTVGLRGEAPRPRPTSSAPATRTSPGTRSCGCGSSTGRRSTATTTTAPTRSCAAPSRPSSARWTAAPARAAGPTASRCCRRPATSTSAR